MKRTVAAIISLFWLLSLGMGYAETSTLTMTVLGIGQADSIILQSDQEAMLVDTGNSRDEAYICDSLDKAGITQLKYLVLTHPHADHIGSAAGIIRKYPIEAIILPPIEYATKVYENVMTAIQAAGIPCIYPYVGDSFQLGAASFYVCGPNPVAYENANDWSLVLRVSYAGRSILLTGDAGMEAEYDMLRSGVNLQADVLKVAHHGSDSATSLAFLQAVSPTYAVVSCTTSSDKEYPSTDVAMTLFECGIQDILTTEKCGEIMVLIQSDGQLVFKQSKPSV